ncbi:hypothetical protein GCM10007872_29720 [Gluconobacter sphaericus NBRC 12467]|uniref:Uncharacterized protein n=1 Tax=Gluconobacter sphaericus NBRC 12467 TaxID=1307951 RepID=A0AA37WBC5_9PROT|nr:hypothetical protein GSP01_16230 [Gluconobacter sphaericus NBRC 12467]GLQ86062.1 hypothetical protein GCM10007872_29720 [Gluconobacter sphaericus NBRC 12467]
MLNECPDPLLLLHGKGAGCFEQYGARAHHADNWRAAGVMPIRCEKRVCGQNMQFLGCDGSVSFSQKPF